MKGVALLHQAGTTALGQTLHLEGTAQQCTIGRQQLPDLALHIADNGALSRDVALVLIVMP